MTFGGGKATPTTIAVAIPEGAALQIVELWAEQEEGEGEAQAALLGAVGHRAMPIYGPTLSLSPDQKARPAHPGIG
jgi:hypothetical protein